MPRFVLVAFGLVMLVGGVQAGDLVRGVRYKLSAGDLPSGIAAVEDYRKANGIDAEYLDAVGWLARGAEMLGRRELAEQYVAELRIQIPSESPETLTALGAAIEVKGKLLAASQGRGAAVRFLSDALARASAPALRSRIEKNINLLTLEGQPAPELEPGTQVGAVTAPTLASLRGKPVLLFLWRHDCGDCKAQAAAVTRVWKTYRPKGLQLIAPTRFYGSLDDKPATPEEELAAVRKVWSDVYAGLDGVPAVISNESMIRYGGSATPTFALIDRKGIVRFYTPTRLSEAELSRRIAELLAEAP